MRPIINSFTYSITLLCLSLIVLSCGKPKKILPVFGQREVVNGDTIYHTIAPFEFTDQDNAIITNATFKNKIYVADFFFTTCRTICPVMKTQMLRVYKKAESMPDVLILSHTIDPEYDNVKVLHDFAGKLGVDSKRWHFVTGKKDSIYKIAQTSYFASAMEDKKAPDGFIHSGSFLLIDTHGRIRGRYDGTQELDVTRLIADIEILRNDKLN